MATAWIITKQTIVMFFLMAVGFWLYRKKILDDHSSKAVASMVLTVVLPATLIKSFCVQRTAERTVNLAGSFLAAAAALLLSIIISRLFFPDNAVEEFGAEFSNAGFVGIPLVQAAFGEEAVFGIAGFLTLLCFGQYVYGVSRLTKQPMKVSPIQLAKNPVIWGVTGGFLVYFSGIGMSLPSVVSSGVTYLSNLNSPLGMLLLGVYLAQTDLKTLFFDRRAYWVCAVRLIIIPAATLALLWVMPMDTQIRLSVLIAAGAPIGCGTASYAQLFDGDYVYAGRIVALSTLLCIVTLPLLIAIAGMILV